MSQKTKNITFESVVDTSSNDIKAKAKIAFSRDSKTANGTVSSSAVVQSASSADISAAIGGQVTSQNNTPVNLVLQGTAASAGNLIADKTVTPTVNLNFKYNSFDNTDVVFRFLTSSIAGAAGSTAATWTDTITAQSLTASSNLIVASYNGLKFYELVADATLSNATFSLNPTRAPSYTVFVFALANENAATNVNSFWNLVNNTNCVHKFVKADWEAASYNQFNFSNLTDFGTNSAFPRSTRSVFAGSTLNAPTFLLNGQIKSQKEAYALNIVDIQTERDFFGDFDRWTKISKGRPFRVENDQRREKDIASDIFTPINMFNLGKLPTVIASPTASTSITVTTSAPTAFPTFSLFFVEMFSYFSGKTVTLSNGGGGALDTYDELVFETLINGTQSYKNILPFNPAADLSSAANYNIKLSNLNFQGSAGSTRMFLFDYLHGTASSEALMRKTSRQVIESLAYQYRALLLKSTTDLTIANSVGSLLFPTQISHPFINIYGRET